MSQLDVRSKGAIDIVASGQLASRVEVGNGFELVPCQSTEGAFYVVSDDSCTCPDHRYRSAVCKHMLALRIQKMLDAAAANRKEEPAF
jgi:uncharacterized Zn finger protein